MEVIRNILNDLDNVCELISDSDLSDENKSSLIDDISEIQYKIENIEDDDE